MYGPRDFRRKKLAAETNQVLGSGGPQALLDGAPVLLQLTHTAVPTRGSITPSFTRATTATGQKWDEAGYLDFTALAGEIVFKGARRVRNILAVTSTENMLGGGFSYSATINSATSVSYLALGNQLYGNIGSGTPAIGTKFCVQVMLSGTPGNTINLYVMNGAANSGAGTQITLTATPTVYSVTGTVTNSSQHFLWLMPASYLTVPAATAVQTITATKWQAEDVTGQTTQTASEYVSVGVESAPAYHGSMVDGVKCYDTDRSGNPISTSGSYPLVGYVPWEARTNLCLQSNAFGTAPWATDANMTVVQNAIGPDGAISAWTFTDNDAAASTSNNQSITLTAATYTASVFIAKTSGATKFPIFCALLGSTDVAICTVDTNNGVATVWTAYTGRSARGTATCVSYNSLFWRVSLAFTGTAAAWAFRTYPCNTTNAAKASGTAGDEPTLTGSIVQSNVTVELGSFATPYQPTTTVAVARNADLLTYTGADVANIKTLAATGSQAVATVNPAAIVGLQNAGGTEWNYWYYLGTGTSVDNKIRIQGYNGSVQWQTDVAHGSQGAAHRVSVSAATNDVKMDFNGIALTQDTVAVMPTWDRLVVGHLNGSFSLNGPVNHIYGWTRPLSQSELGAVDR